MQFDLGQIRTRLGRHQPQLLDTNGTRHAGVALVLTKPSAGDVQALFIERSRRTDDPWSGQMGLPGGMVEPQDRDSRGAAERETAEEVGLWLAQTDYLGRLDDMEGRHAGHPSGIVVSGFVYVVGSTSELRANYEVADTVWVPLGFFFDPLRYTTVAHPAAPDQRFPGVRVSDASHQVVWGLTRRFLRCFFNILDVPFRG